MSMAFNYLDYAFILRSPIDPIKIEEVLPVTLRRSISGVGYTYIKTPKKYRLTFTSQVLTGDDRDGLLSFFNVTHPNIFALTDYDDIQWFVQFLDPKLDISEVSTIGNIWQTTIRLEGSRNG